VKAPRGFTLIEVLVALVIVALGMSALLESLGSAADTATWLRDKTFAQWIGFNQLETLRLSGQLPSDGTSDGELDYAGRHWRWRQIVSDLGFPGLFRIDVKVEPADTSSVDENGWMATVTGAVGNAVSPPQLQSLYPDPSLPGSSAPSGPYTGSTATPDIVSNRSALLGERSNCSCQVSLSATVPDYFNVKLLSSVLTRNRRQHRGAAPAGRRAGRPLRAPYRYP